MTVVALSHSNFAFNLWQVVMETKVKYGRGDASRGMTPPDNSKGELVTITDKGSCKLILFRVKVRALVLRHGKVFLLKS